MEIECPDCRRVIEFSREAPRFCSYCGKALTDTKPPVDRTDAAGDQTRDYTGPSPPQGGSPAHLGEYRVVRELGRGGMGVVCRL
jgi:hypothetical protein